MHENEIKTLLQEFQKLVPEPSTFVELLPVEQATVITKIAARNAHVLAKEWNLPLPAENLEEEIDNDSEGDDFGPAFTVTWMLTVYGYLMAQFYFQRTFKSSPVDLGELNQTCNQHLDDNLYGLVPDALERLSENFSESLLVSLKHNQQSSGYLRDIDVHDYGALERIKKALIAGIYVWQMADIVRQRSN